ncbi:MAG: hypothetical protein ABGX16_23415 [Pirellulales bacterium]
MLVIAVFPYLLTGCGQSLPATVAGTITLDGQSLPEGPRVTGSVMYYPLGGGAAAYGTVTSGGTYTMQTGDTLGLQPGDYQVTVRVIDIDPPPLGGYNNPPASKPITPPRYQNREQAGLKVQVKQGKNEINLELSSS